VTPLWCPTNTGNISVTASHPGPVLAYVAQALLPVRFAGEASALGTGKSACATSKLIHDGCPLLFFSGGA
jgi:hypothetical protein